METQTEEIWITVKLERTPTGYSSTHHIAGIDELSAACILIDVGRDILAYLAAHHHHEPVATTESGEAAQQEENSGH